MCGIVGIASLNKIQNREWISEAKEEMIHRGPDDQGEWWSYCGCVGLGHRRLSIVDLTKAGHQPMSNKNGMLHIVFNGEIYNYLILRNELEQLGETFFSNSDTEVLLLSYKQWGVECLSHINGMFAFAIYDIHKGVLFMARDRVGEKPLYYNIFDKIFRFSSELCALIETLPDINKIDPESLDFYLCVGYVPSEKVIVKGIRKLPPAHACTYDIRSGDLKIWKYWNIPLNNNASLHNPDIDLLLEELEVLVESSVFQQMQADVPVGVLLSGGVDSSLITAIARRNSNHVKTFTIRFPGYEKFDETKHARLISDYFRTDHVELDICDIEHTKFIDIIKKFDSPIIDSSVIPTFLLSQLVKDHCTVVLGGDGGDELFGGYKYYSRILWLKKYFGMLPLGIRRFIASYADTGMPLRAAVKNWIRMIDTDFNSENRLITTIFSQEERRRILKDYTLPILSEDYFARMEFNNCDMLDRLTRVDLNNFLVDDVLLKVDRASMLNSLEVRAPFLDYRLVEFAFSKIPSSLKATASNKKILLKMLAKKVLPNSFDYNRKQGFEIPLNQWLKNKSWNDMFYDILTDKNSIFNVCFIDNLFLEQKKGVNNGERLFGLFFFEVWRQSHELSF
jgi:asparagine synthase (glutamine-hydrolysing)